MSASKECKEAGLPSLQYVSEKTDTHIGTLHNWHKNKPKLFKAVVYWAAAMREKELKKGE